MQVSPLVLLQFSVSSLFTFSLLQPYLLLQPYRFNLFFFSSISSLFWFSFLFVTLMLATTGLLHSVSCLLSDYYRFLAYRLSSDYHYTLLFFAIFSSFSLLVQSPLMHSFFIINDSLLVSSLSPVELFKLVLSLTHSVSSAIFVEHLTGCLSGFQFIMQQHHLHLLIHILVTRLSRLNVSSNICVLRFSPCTESAFNLISNYHGTSYPIRSHVLDW